MGWLIELLPFSLVWSASICSFLEIFFPLGWEVVDVCLGSSLVWIYEEYTQFFSEYCRSTAGSSLDEKILVWTSCMCSLREICFSACSWGITETQGVWESPASSSDPVQYENKVRSGSSKRFFEVQFVKLLCNKHRALLVAKHDRV